MKTRRHLILLAALVLITSTICRAQTRDGDASRLESAPPPTEALALFGPYFGLYAFSGDFAGAPYRGTLEVKPAVNGWYVEWVINVHNVREEDPPIDRQLRMLATWDRFAKQYRIWRFETDSPLTAGEGTARFDGDEFVMEWRMPNPDGKPGTLRNRVSMKHPSEIVIVSEGESDGGEVVRIGVGTGKRRL